MLGAGPGAAVCRCGADAGAAGRRAAGIFLLLTLLLVLEVRYLRGKVEAELIVPDQPAVQGRPFVLTVRLTNHSPLPIPNC